MATATANAMMPTAAAADVANAAIGMWRLFFDSSNGDKLSAKDENGVVVVVGSGAATLQSAYEAGRTIDLVSGENLRIGATATAVPTSIELGGSAGLAPGSGPGTGGGAGRFEGGPGGESVDDVGGDGAPGNFLGGLGGNGNTQGGAGAVGNFAGGNGGPATAGPGGAAGPGNFLGGDGGGSDTTTAADGAPATLRGGTGGIGVDAGNNGFGGVTNVQGGHRGGGGLAAEVNIQTEGSDTTTVNIGGGLTTINKFGVTVEDPNNVAYDAGPTAYAVDMLKGGAVIVDLSTVAPLIFTSASTVLAGSRGSLIVKHSVAFSYFSDYQISGDGTVFWADGALPSLSAGLNDIDILDWLYDGEHVYLNVRGLGYAIGVPP